MASTNRASVGGWGGALLFGAPLLLLITVAIGALLFTTSPREVAEQWANPEVRSAVWLSMRTTLLATLTVAVLGSACAIAIARAPAWLSAILEVLVTLPAILPPSVAGLALLLALGRQGVVGQMLERAGVSLAFTTSAVILAQIFVAAPFFIREVEAGIRSVDPHLVEAARLDGASPWDALVWVIAPLVRPFLLAGLVLAWSRAMGEFGATILFAGNLPGETQTMPLAIYMGFQSDLGQAKALAIILLVLAVGVLIAFRVLTRTQRAFH